VLGLAGCGPTAIASSAASQAILATGAPSAAALKWPAPADPMGLAVKAGLVPEPKEQLAYHVHVHLDVFIDGQAVLVPAGIGINITDPDVHTFDDPSGVSYGGIQLCAQPCISPLHTHDVTGVIHTESATPAPNTLGQFFIQWGVPLSATCVGEFCAPQKPVAFYVNGKASTGDPSTIQLADRSEIAIVIGTPPPVIPAIGDFAGL
jgi:hypothetical protein